MVERWKRGYDTGDIECSRTGNSVVADVVVFDRTRVVRRAESVEPDPEQ
jgi:hypothetical protein